MAVACVITNSGPVNAQKACKTVHAQFTMDNVCECIRIKERNCAERARAAGGKRTLSSSVCASDNGQGWAAHRPEADASTPPGASALCASSSSSRRRSSATLARAPAASLCIISSQSTSMVVV